MIEIRELIANLSCHGPSCVCRRAVKAEHGLVHCPAHHDMNPSLSLNEKDGKVVWRCMAGCSQEAVTEALRERGLLGGDAADARERRTAKAPAGGRLVEKRYEIRDAAGKLVAEHVRYRLASGKKAFDWRRPDGRTGLNGTPVSELPLYGSEHLAGQPDKPVVIVEGEKAADALRALGVLALGTVTGASSTPSLEVLRVLSGRSKAVLWPDNDDSGRQHVERVAARLHQLGVPVFVVEWKDAPPKGDAADYVETHEREDLACLLREARLWEPSPQPERPGLELRAVRTTPTSFYLKLPDLPEVGLSAAQLRSWEKIETQCLEQMVRPPTWRPSSPREWPRILDRLLLAANVEEAPPEFTRSGRFRDLLNVFFERVGEDRTVIADHSPFRDAEAGQLVFRVGDLIQHLKRSGETEISSAAVLESLRALGCELRRVRVDGVSYRVVALAEDAVFEALAEEET